MALGADAERMPGEFRPLFDDPELYGVGVRIGTYTQWLCTILAVCLVHDPQERDSMRNVNYAFALAEWVTLVTRTRLMYPADAVMVAFIFMGTLTLLCMPEVFDRMRPRIVRRQGPNFGNVEETARMMLLLAFTIWVIWWWFEGIYHTSKDCGTYIFYYGIPVPVLGNIKLIGRIWAALLPLMFIPVLEKFWFFIQRTRAHHRAQRDPLVTKDGPPINVWSWDFWLQAATETQEEMAEQERSHPPDIPNPQTKQRRGLYCALLLGTGVFMFVIFIEITLAYGNVGQINHISGVGDTVPMIIGCGNMLAVLWRQKEREVDKVPFPFFLIVLSVRASLIIFQRLRLGPNYRPPKTFLYDAEFLLFRSMFPLAPCINLLLITPPTMYYRDKDLVTHRRE